LYSTHQSIDKRKENTFVYTTHAER